MSEATPSAYSIVRGEGTCDNLGGRGEIKMGQPKFHVAIYNITHSSPLKHFPANVVEHKSTFKGSYIL